MMRLDKLLGEMGIGTRSQIKDMARKGQITVDGAVEKKPERKVDEASQIICVAGRPIPYVRTEYYLLNKPQGVVSATADNLHKTVVDLITDRKREDLFPVGRLDLDTEGLLLITNDGELAHELLSPKSHVDKVYEAQVEGYIPEDAPIRMKEGLILSDGTKTLPAKLELLGREKCGEGKELSRIRLTIREGKFHQVKRMFETLGCHVVYLKRISMGSLRLDDTLKPGQYRPLTEEEIAALKGKEQEQRC